MSRVALSNLICTDLGRESILFRYKEVALNGHLRI